MGGGRGRCVWILNIWFLQNLHKQLEEAIQDGEIWVMQLKDTEYELEGSRERVQQQATEILHKASKPPPDPADPHYRTNTCTRFTFSTS